MTYKCRAGFAKGANAKILEAQIPEGDRLIAEYARAADLPATDAKKILDGNLQGIDGAKAIGFHEVIAYDYGDMDTFKITCAALNGDFA